MAPGAPQKKGAGKGDGPPKQHWVVTVVEASRAGIAYGDKKLGDLASHLELEGGTVLEPKAASRFKKNNHMPKRSRDCCNFLIPVDEDDNDPPPSNMFSVPSSKDSWAREHRQLMASHEDHTVVAAPKPMTMPARPNCFMGGGTVMPDEHYRNDGHSRSWQYPGHHAQQAQHHPWHGPSAASAPMGAGRGVGAGVAVAGAAAAVGTGVTIDHGAPVQTDWDEEEDTSVYEDLVMEDYEGPEAWRADNSMAGDIWSALA